MHFHTIFILFKLVETQNSNFTNTVKSKRKTYVPHLHDNYNFLLDNTRIQAAAGVKFCNFGSSSISVFVKDVLCGQIAEHLVICCVCNIFNFIDRFNRSLKIHTISGMIFIMILNVYYVHHYKNIFAQNMFNKNRPWQIQLHFLFIYMCETDFGISVTYRNDYLL